MVRELFREYRLAADAEACFTTFEEELAALPAGYDMILVANLDARPIGCVALRSIAARDCELKRLYVRPQAQGRGVGRELVEAAMSAAIERGYQRMRLDTLPTMTRAIEMYRAMGFTSIGRYNDTPDAGTLFFEKLLG